MQQQQAQTLEASEQRLRYEPNKEFLQTIEKLEKEVNSKEEHVRRQLEAVFQPR